MSKSRLEKFLYAIYTLDYSDLPKPLSRIEELYNCWATGGEVPTFTPLSRVEKYLMAILGNYDISELPEPLSRVEVLLHKLVMGDDNLEEIKSFLSRHEELLAGIIRDGGFSGSDDFYRTVTSLAYAHNTLYYTAEEPVKSAILTGETLVNVDSYYTSDDFVNSHISAITDDFYIQLVANGEWRNSFTKLKSSIKPNTKYLAIVEIKENTLDGSFTLFSQHNVESAFSGQAKTLSSGTTGIFKCILTSISEFDSTTNVCLRNYIDNNTTSGNIKFRTMLIEYQEGMENWDIPYFEGMQSVKMPVLTTVGKNLLNMQDYNLRFATTLVDSTNNSITFTTTAAWGGLVYDFYLKPNQEYYVSHESPHPSSDLKCFIRLLNTSSSTIGGAKKFSFTTDSTGKVRLTLETTTALSDVTATNIQIEEGSVATTYEPYKSNILTVNEDVTLRGIGDVRDELDLLTGELTQRIGEIVLDGTENIRLQAELGEVNRYFLNIKTPNVSWTNYQLSNYLLFNGTDFLGDYEHFYLDGDGNVMLFAKNKTVNELQERLKQNNLTIQYRLANESIKTVDLSVVDQDGNDTKLKTFKDTTHVTLSSGGLIPTGEMEVAMQIQHVIYNLANSLNTLYNTLDRSPKNAILKGNTLVNLLNFSDFVNTDYAYKINDVITSIAQNNNAWCNCAIRINNATQNSTYIMCWDDLTYTHTDNRGTNQLLGIYGFDDINTQITISATQLNQTTNYLIFTIPSTIVSEVYVRIHASTFTGEQGATTTVKGLKVIEYQDGMENWDIPYFEGMQSVKMPVLKATGKNLFDLELTQGGHSYGVAGTKPVYNRSDNRVTNLTGTYIKVNPNTKITFSILNNIDFAIAELDINGYNLGDTGWVGYTTIKPNHTITTKEKTSYIGFNFRKFDNSNITIQEVLDSNPMLEISGTATTYEPYKSNILTVNEDVELRGVGGVQDELNLLTGELTQHIGEVVLDGSEEYWGLNALWSSDETDYCCFYNAEITKNIIKVLSADKLATKNANELRDYETNLAIGEGIRNDIANIQIFLAKSKLTTVDVDGLKQYLQSNPITVQFQLTTESVKTVDLSVVDQDGNDTKLKTFEDITHVILSSGGLIPTGEMEVATKNLGDINNTVAMSLRMNDISSTQKTLEEVSDAQSESIDATMMATTEVYEQIL